MLDDKRTYLNSLNKDFILEQLSYAIDAGYFHKRFSNGDILLAEDIWNVICDLEYFESI